MYRLLQIQHEVVRCFQRYQPIQRLSVIDGVKPFPSKRQLPWHHFSPALLSFRHPRSITAARSATSPPLALQASVRHHHTTTNAANFDSEVLHSQQAICLVFYIPGNNSCTAYLDMAEELVDTLNAEATPATETSKQPQSTPKTSWIKLCLINADQNRNLASAFSVERARLPCTYFIMQGTIIDKVTGSMAKARLQRILLKFLEHYQAELHVDLLSRRRQAGANGGTGEDGEGGTSPLPTAAAIDLLGGTSTAYLQQQAMQALLGSNMIRLPEEAAHLDGLRKTLQQAKKKAYEELADLYRQLGIGVRRLSEAEMQAHYYQSPQLKAMAALCALETLFLARCFAVLGDVPRQNVEWAKRAAQTEYAAAQSDPAVRRVMALVEVNLVKGELRAAALTASQDANRLSSVLVVMEEGESQQQRQPSDALSPSSLAGRPGHVAAMRSMAALVQLQSAYCREMLSLIDDHVDSRAPEGGAFPAAVADQLFCLLKENMKLSKQRCSGASSDASPSRDADAEMLNLLEGREIDITPKQVRMAEARVQQLRAVITALLQMYASDPGSHPARARLSSLVY